MSLESFHAWIALKDNNNSRFLDISIPIISETSWLFSSVLHQLFSSRSCCLDKFFFDRDNSNNSDCIFISILALGPNILRFENSDNSRDGCPFFEMRSSFLDMFTTGMNLKCFHALKLFDSNSWSWFLHIFVPVILDISLFLSCSLDQFGSHRFGLLKEFRFKLWESNNWHLTFHKKDMFN